MAATADVGLIGLAVMGENLALNIADHGYKVAVYNRTTEVMKKFIARENPPGGLVGCGESEGVCGGDQEAAEDYYFSEGGAGGGCGREAAF